jgi:hypothetical protein
MTTATGSVATEGDRQWFLVWLFLAVVVSLAVLGILLGTRNNFLAVAIVVLSLSGLLSLPLLLIFVLGPSAYESTDWTILATSLFLEVYLVGYTASWHLTKHSTIEKAKKAAAAKQRATLTVGHVSTCDYVGLCFAYASYLALACTGRLVMSASTDNATRAVWVLLYVLVVLVFAGFAFHITRFTLHVKHGPVSLFLSFGLLFAISVLLIVLAPALTVVVDVEIIMSGVTGTIALISGLHLVADCCMHRERLPWTKPPTPIVPS